MARFGQYRKASDFKPLLKLDVGDGFKEPLVGSHVFTTEDGDELPVLDFQEFSWMASTWHALQELADCEPQDGETVRVRRLADKGRSHQYEVRVLDAAGNELAARIGGEVPSNLPHAGQGTVVADEDIPFAASVI